MRRGLALLLGAVLAAAAAAPAAAGDAPLVVRSFEIRHRGAAEAAELVGGMLSPEGSVLLQPKLRTVVVTDLPAVVDRVAATLGDFDVPPRNVEISFTLLVGTDARGAAAGRGMDPRTLSQEIRGVHENLGDFTKWTNYDLLGSQSVTAVEGQGGVARLSEDYRVTFQVAAVEPPTARAPEGIIVLRRLVLERVRRDPSGAERADEVYATALQLHAGRLLTVGAAQSPESRQALFLTIKARPE